MDVKTEKEDYSYVFQICGDVADVPGAGIVQVERKKTGTQSTMIGTYNSTQVIGGSKLSDYHKLVELCPRGAIAAVDDDFCVDSFPTSPVLPGEWVMLSYRNPSKYEPCTKPMSQAIVMITCSTKTVVRLFCQNSFISESNVVFFQVFRRMGLILLAFICMSLVPVQLRCLPCFPAVVSRMTSCHASITSCLLASCKIRWSPSICFPGLTQGLAGEQGARQRLHLPV